MSYWFFSLTVRVISVCEKLTFKMRQGNCGRFVIDRWGTVAATAPPAANILQVSCGRLRVVFQTSSMAHKYVPQNWKIPLLKTFFFVYNVWSYLFSLHGHLIPATASKGTDCKIGLICLQAVWIFFPASSATPAQSIGCSGVSVFFCHMPKFSELFLHLSSYKIPLHQTPDIFICMGVFPFYSLCISSAPIPNFPSALKVRQILPVVYRRRRYRCWGHPGPSLPNLCCTAVVWKICFSHWLFQPRSAPRGVSWIDNSPDILIVGWFHLWCCRSQSSVFAQIWHSDFSHLQVLAVYSSVSYSP